MYNENENKEMGTDMNVEKKDSMNQTADQNMSSGADNATQTDTQYRYDRNYYEQHRDENTAFHYDQPYRNTTQGTDQQAGQSTQGAYNQNMYQSNPFNNGQNYQYQANETQAKESRRERRKRERAMKKNARAGKNTAARLARGVACLVLVAAVASASTYGTIQLFGQKNSGSNVVVKSTAIGSSDSVKAVSSTNVTGDISSVVSEVMPSVVSISNIGTETVNSFFGQQTYDTQSSGSGIIVGQNDTELLIVTNQHVISGANTLNVTFIDEKTYTANVKGSDSNLDIAVIAIELSELSEDTLNQIKVATLGDSSKLAVGQTAIAIGNALGYGQSVTTGVISALNREVTVDETTTKSLIQTDAAINPGNSGGALLNTSGEVIGINSVKYASTEVEGMGYAIPVSDVTDVINEMMNEQTKKKVDSSETGYLGISPVDVTSSVAQTYNMPEGVYVAQVEDGSAAAQAGIKKGDIITKLGGTTITSSADLTAELQYHAAGSKVEVVIQSPLDKGYGYEEKTVEVTLDKKSN